ncbi:hypothetical protein [Actinomyces sp. ZJ308]|uniref:hypothetical protein n=1 Tax=Actinomyces sp. ZJ308 TaxID=2708342 RepID=UPI0014247ABE|nr:hypothetical protein [Actinomyces sp. ZJ308]
MTASTEASSDTEDTDVDADPAADQASSDAAAGQDAGVGPVSLAFTSFLLALLCFSPFYMLGSNLWDLVNGRGLLLEFTDSSAVSEEHLAFGHTTVEMSSGHSTTYGTVHGLSGGAQFFTGLFITVHLVLIAACAVAFVRFIAAIRPGRPGFVDQLFTRGGHLFWLLLGQTLSSLMLQITSLGISDEYFTNARTGAEELSGSIPTGNDIPTLKEVIVLILATHLLLALHRLYQRSSSLAAENTALREETEGLV